MKRGGQHAASYGQEEAPRPVALKARNHQRSTAAVKGSSPRRWVSPQQAQRDLIINLSQPMNGKQTAALFRLREAFSTTKEDLSPEFFAPVIKDLDTVLFSGCLGGRILVDWTDMPTTSRRILRGVSLPRGVSRVSKVYIRLNRAMFEADSKEDIWGIVVHEMVHAYLALTSGWRGMLMRHHKSPFEECCKSAVGRLALDGFETHHVV
ncbi:hypothetical protein Q7P35_012302 [Cladosporium inversicolor]